MPSLICSSRYTIDSQILRRTAQQLGWDTLRLDGNEIPDWFEPPDEDIAFFYTAPGAFEVASQLGRQLIGCQPDWTVKLPSEFLRRELRQTTLNEALGCVDQHFVKHSVSKVFPAAVYDADSLRRATAGIHPDSLVHIGEPVKWTHEYRCFVAGGAVMSISPYVYDGAVVADYDSFPVVSPSELQTVRSVVDSLLSHPDVEMPAAFTLDVGWISDRGWAVVECNECWASGIYACDPAEVLRTLMRGAVRTGTIERRWDFSRHYAQACPDRMS